MTTKRSDPTNEHEWFPTPESMAAYVNRDAMLAVGNARILAMSCEPRHMLAITNGRAPGYGYVAISVIRGGIDPSDSLHLPSTIARANARYCGQRGERG